MQAFGRQCRQQGCPKALREREVVQTFRKRGNRSHPKLFDTKSLECTFFVEYGPACRGAVQCRLVLWCRDEALLNGSFLRLARNPECHYQAKCTERSAPLVSTRPSGRSGEIRSPGRNARRYSNPDGSGSSTPPSQSIQMTRWGTSLPSYFFVRR